MDFRGPLEKVKYLKDACSFSGNIVMKGANQINHMRTRQSISAHLISSKIMKLYTYTSRISTVCAPQPPSPGAFASLHRTYDCTQAWIGCKG